MRALANTFQQLWDEFNQMEEYRPLLLSTKRHHCLRMLSVIKNNHKIHEIQLEIDLITYGMESYECLSLFDGNQLDKFKNLTTSFIKCHSNSDFEHFRNRINETSNASDKWRYALICWSFDKDMHFMDEVLALLFDSAKRRFNKDKPSESVRLISYIYSLIKMNNLQDSRSELVTQVCEFCLQSLRMLVNSDEPRYANELFLIYVNLNKNVNHAIASELITILHKAASKAASQKRPRVEQMLLEASALAFQFLSLNSAEKFEMKKLIYKKIGESIVKEGNEFLKQGTGVVAAYFYKEATEYFKKAESKNSVEKLYKKISEVSNMGWNVIEYRIPILEMNIEGNNAYEIIQSICSQRHIIPDSEIIRKSAKENLEEYPLLGAVTNVKFTKQGPKNDGSSAIDLQSKTSMVEHILLGEATLAANVRKLELAKKINSDTVIQFIGDFGILNQNSLTLVSKGIKMHFEGDYISSIHILTPQIESTLRSFLESKGFKMLKEKNRALLENELGGLLAKSQTREILGEKFCRYLQLKYVDYEAINLRNEVSHGLLELNQFNHTNSFSIIQTIMMILSAK